MIDKAALSRSKAIVLGLIGVAVLYKLLTWAGQGHTSLMFVGLPALLAILVTLTPSSKSTTGTVMKATTIMLLLAAILAIEGAACILMAAPLVYLVAWGVAALINWSNEEETQFWNPRVSLIVPIVVVALHGNVPGTAGDRTIDASAVRTVDMTADEVREAILEPPSFDDAVPAFFRYGRFPRPLSCRLVDDRLVIEFEDIEPAHHKMRTHQPTRPQLVLEIADIGPRHVEFVPVHDSTVIAQWATLTSSVVTWEETPNGTRVTWRIRAERKLDPAWYFGPVQTYAAGRAADYLITAVVE